MKTIFRATAALALLAASLPALAASATVTRAWQFKPESNAGLAVRNLIGNIRVERGTTPGVHITANTTVEAATQAEAERLAGLIDFRSSDVGPGSRFDVRLPHEHFPKIYSEKGASGWFSTSYVDYLGERIRLVGDKDEAPAVRVDLVIRAPAGAKLDVSNVVGDIVAQNYSGKLRLDGGSGLLTSTGGEGELELDNGSGEVVVSGHRGRVSADTGSGSVKITDCECEILADTGSGSVDVQRGKGSVSADTGSGGVQVEGFSGVRRGHGLRLGPRARRQRRAEPRRGHGFGQRDHRGRPLGALAAPDRHGLRQREPALVGPAVDGDPHRYRQRRRGRRRAGRDGPRDRTT